MTISTMLKENGLKRTAAREHVLAYLIERDVPISAEMLYRALSAQGVDINLSTVYRTLDIFERRGLIVKNTTISESCAVYAFKRDGHGHHIVCVNCGDIFPLETCPMKHTEAEIERTTQFKILRHKLEVFGICPKCQGTEKHH